MQKDIPKDHLRLPGEAFLAEPGRPEERPRLGEKAVAVLRAVKDVIKFCDPDQLYDQRR